MDKNTSRTDMLAAGRKKLQQFRQKKDGKISGSHGKSSKKATKSEPDSDVATSAAEPQDSVHIPELEVGTKNLDTNASHVDLSVPQPIHDSVSPESSVPTVDATAVQDHHDSIGEVMHETCNSRLPADGSEIAEAVVSNEGERPMAIESDMERVASLGAFEIADSAADESMHATGSLPVHFSAPLSTDAMNHDTKSVDGEDKRKLLSSDQDLSDALLIQAREVQATDLGAMQEADSSGLNQMDSISGIEINGPDIPNFSKLPEPAENDTEVGVGASMTESTCEAEPPGVPVEGNELGGVFSTMGMIVDGTSSVDAVVLDQLSENLAVTSSDVDQTRTYCPSDDSREYMEVAVQPEEFKVMESDIRDGSLSETLGTKMLSSSGGKNTTSKVEGNSISLLQLADLLKALDEDDFSFLFKSKESPINSRLEGFGSFSDHKFSEVLESYKEQIYLSNITKDISTLQLTEQSNLEEVFNHQRQQLDDEISLLSASHVEVSETNKRLSEELQHYLSELQAVTSEREELRHQLQTATTELADFSVRVHELQNELESSRGDASSKSMELAECKNLVDSLQLENFGLSSNLTSAMEEWKKVEQELTRCKDLVVDIQTKKGELSESLAFVTEERKKFEAAKEDIVCENENLLSQLADRKRLVEAVQAEKANAIETLALMTDNVKKLGEEKHYYAHESDRLTSEFAECQSLVETLQSENANLIEGLSLVTSDRSKLEEEKEYLTGEINELSSNLHVHQELLSVSQAEYLQLEADLKEMKLQVDQLIEENIFLGSSLDIHQGKIREIRNMQIQLAVESREASNQIESRDLYEESHQSSDKQDGEFLSSLLQRKALSDDYEGEEAIKELGQNVYSDVPGFVDLNGHFEEAIKTILKLEKAIKEMHSHSVSLSTSVSKVSASGVSKLIQAFESKTHLEDGDVEQNISTDDLSIKDPFMSSEELTKKLRALLKELQLEAVNASEVLKGERNDKDAANIAYNELKIQYEGIHEHTDKLEAMNIELLIQCESVKQHVYNVEDKKSELLDLYSTLQQENISLKIENTEVGKKLKDFHARIDELNGQLGEFQQSSEEGASQICIRIENLSNEVAENLEAACIKYEAISNSYSEVNEQMNTLREKNKLAIWALNKIYDSLRKLVISSDVSLQQDELKLQNDKLLDYLDIRKYEDLIEQLGTFLRETVLLKFENTKLNNELRSSNSDVEELKARCLDLNVVLKLVTDVEAVVKCESLIIDLDKPPMSRLDSSVGFLLQSYIQTDDRVKLMSEELASKVSEASELREKVTQLDSLILLQKNEIADFTESLSQAEEALVANRAELKEKTLELEQSEQRVSSIREKLSIAVGKGKGLIVQRDNLKQSLTEISAKLERSSQELQLKDARLHETEEKLKMYSEAGERVEALESELSYIRNSATALRESFLLKDSVIQRIEEILEDLELPDNFHSRDIIEKVDWLARSVCGNSMPQVDWDQKSSVEGGSYADAGFVAMDGWKEDVQPNSNSGDDLRRKYEELEVKFYGLAEQNEMLEQSLMERNNLVQRWEEVLGKINVSTQVRSMEPEDRIAWLGNELSEVHQYANDLQQKIENLENHCGSLTSDLEQSQIKLREVETALEVATHDKGHLSKSLETLTVDHEKLSHLAAQFELANDKLQNELICLQEKLAKKRYHEQQAERIEGEIVRLQDLVSNALQDPAEVLVSGVSNIEYLEGLLIKLVDKYTSLCSEVPLHIDATVDEVRNREILDAENSEVLFLKKELEAALSDVMRLTEEANVHVETRRSLGSEVEALNKKIEELQQLLIQEEKKSGSAREKLNVAVRKGKSLVQQRDSLKQTIEELNTEIASLKTVISEQENIVSQSEQKIKDLSTYSERVVVLESENLSLKDHLTETEHLLNERGHTLAMILDTVAEIDIGGDHGSYNDPVYKLEQHGKRCSELQAAVGFSEQESKKSKRAAALLVEELNEVQERNDSLQEELANTSSELLALSKEKDMVHAAKLEALSRLEKLSSAYSEVKKNEYAALVALKSVVHKFSGSFREVNNLLADILLKDLEFWHNLEACMELCLKPNGATNVAGLPLVNIHGDASNHSNRKDNFVGEEFGSHIKKQEYRDGSEVAEICRDVECDLQGFITDVNGLKEKLQKHSLTLHEKGRKLSTSLESISTKLTSQTQSLEALKNDTISFDSIRKEKDRENVVLCKSTSLLYEACASSIMEIENSKPHLFGEDSTVGDLGRKLKSIAAAAVNGQLVLSGPTLVSSQEQIRTLADGLSLLVKKLISMEAEILDGGQKEMKATIANLHRELQEKDMQRDRICMELASQIRGAEAAATKYLNDYQSAKNHVHDLEKCMEGLEEECASLKQRVNELQDREAASIELQEKVQSMTETVAAKDQEIESLMQALDEEEMQLEELVNKNSELEKVVQQKDIDVENLEASRGKAMKKLSITVSRFDELHNLSASLLAEVEKLQSQLQDRDSEISFLRQEVTRCTSDVLTASQTNNNTNSDELHGLLTWLGEVIFRAQVHDFQLDREGSQIHDFKEILQNQITSIVTELEDLRTIARSKDAQIEMERGRVEELTRKGDTLENSLRQKETQLKIMKNARGSGEEGSTSPEIVEVEPAINQWNVPGTSITSKVRSLRKVNNDQVAISIDTDLDNNRLEDEDDDKVHGFKSLTSSRIVPRFTRPVSDMVDGLWVSCDRALMRQPALRLGIIIYWAVLHALFASFAV